MSVKVEKIVEDALTLSVHARAYIAEQLIESLDSATEHELSEAWRVEIRKRCREIDEEEVELREADEVFAKAFAVIQ